MSCWIWPKPIRRVCLSIACESGLSGPPRFHVHFIFCEVMTKYSTRIDAADFSDGQKTCCMLPLRWATVTFGILFGVAGACQLFEQVYRATGGAVSGYNIQEKRLPAALARACTVSGHSCWNLCNAACPQAKAR
eukprot:s44_g33.t1